MTVYCTESVRFESTAQFSIRAPSNFKDQPKEIEMNYITVVRGRLKGTPQEAQMGHDATVEKLSAMTRPMGAIGHRPHLNPQDPTEFLAIDT